MSTPTSSLPSSDAQRAAYERSYGHSAPDTWVFHDTRDPLVRFLRDRRLQRGVDHFLRVSGLSAASLDALVVCGGVGGEGSYLADRGFGAVTVSDFSDNALAICSLRDPRLQIMRLDAMQLDVPDESFDVVLVQDGLHELRQPTIGFTEMLRVARRAAIVIEPHAGLVARGLGTTWESHEGVENYVFRWSRSLVREVAHSYLLRRAARIDVLRFWDHNVTMKRVADRFGGDALGLAAARATYRVLDLGAPWLGNMMVAVVCKPAGVAGAR